jgi:hypothetical protein
MGVALLAVASTSCFSRSVRHQTLSTIAPSEAVPVAAQTEALGDVLAPQLTYPLYLFEDATPPAGVQRSSVTLVKVVEPRKRLHIIALKSTRETAAVFVQEISIHTHWGVLMIPAERQIIRAFADDPSLGKWLILLTDVDVRGDPDPIPLTAYRWTRLQVEQYKACGIPDTMIDECTKAFYHLAKTVLVSTKVGNQGQ